MATTATSGPDGSAYPSVPNLAPMTSSPNGNAYETSLPSQSIPPALGATAAAQSTPNPSAARSVKRPRPVKSCTECRKRKLKCDRNLPCSQCQKSQRTCKYAADQDSSALSDISDSELAELQPGRPAKRNCLGTVHGSGGASHLEPVLPATLRNGDSGSGGALSPYDELATRLERLEQAVLTRSPGITSHTVGGAPRLPLPLSAETVRGLTVKGEALRTRFFGQSSVRVLLNLVLTTCLFSCFFFCSNYRI